MSVQPTGMKGCNCLSDTAWCLSCVSRHSGYASLKPGSQKEICHESGEARLKAVLEIFNQDLAQVLLWPPTLGPKPLSALNRDLMVEWRTAIKRFLTNVEEATAESSIYDRVEHVCAQVTCLHESTLV